MSISRIPFAGLRGGVVAGCVFLTVQLAARVLFGVPSLPELIQDRLVQMLPGPVFAFFISRLLYLGKPMLFGSLLAAQLGLAALGGAIIYRWRQPAVVAMLMWSITGFLVLPLAHRGVFDGSAGVALTLALAYAAYAVALVELWTPGTIRVFRSEPVLTAPSGRSLGRRELMGGVVFLVAAAALARKAIGDLPKLPPKRNGLPDPITSADDFYDVSKNIVDPEVDINSWRLKVDGLVSTPLDISYGDLQAMPSEEFIRTLECISNEVGGDLISNGKFTGVRMSDVLKRVGVKPEAALLHFTSIDGFTESMPVEKAMDANTFLVYKLDGAALPRKHGFPVRVLGTGTYGMKNPKWLNRIELVTTAAEGFWEHQGWSNDAIVQTMSRIDAPRGATPTGSVDIEGISFAGDRGISAIEVSTDNGKTWEPADLLPALGPLTWVFWRRTKQLSPGSYDVIVRATDGRSQPQVSKETDTYPDGSTGYHKMRIQVTGSQIAS